MSTIEDVARRTQLKGISETYFAALAKGDVSGVPWRDDVVVRSPLAPEGLEVPVRGNAFSGLWW